MPPLEHSLDDTYLSVQNMILDCLIQREISVLKARLVSFSLVQSRKDDQRSLVLDSDCTALT